MIEDFLPPTLLQDIELRLGVTNAAFLVESLLPNVIDFIQLITRRRSTTLPPQKEQKEAGTIPKHSKQPMVVFPIKEAWLGCALKLIIMDDANRPSSSSSKSEYGPWVCHTVVRASFQTRTGIISIPFKQHEAISSLQVSTSNSEIMSEGQVVPHEPESVKVQEDYILDSISNNPLAQILSISCLNLSLSLDSGPELLCIQDIEAEFQNHFSAVNQSNQILDINQGYFSNLSISKRLLWAQIGLVKAYLPLGTLETISRIMITLPKRGKGSDRKPKQRAQKSTMAHPIETTLKLCRLDVVLLDDRHNGASSLIFRCFLHRMGRAKGKKWSVA
jgi:hypothetical protein